EFPIVKADAEAGHHWQDQKREEPQQAGQEEEIGDQLFLSRQAQPAEANATRLLAAGCRPLAEHLTCGHRGPRSAAVTVQSHVEIPCRELTCSFLRACPRPAHPWRAM